ncbi:toxin C-terminal domain-containing protein [Caminibacter pacificus]|uniref:RNase toxin 21 of polymorphic toxin system n=1 Tax=Caminibacter pacificus TaxID=1424653 RepID=A0AAJ4UXJ4_9BACT|nr:toxin C-terminal domain-containing protein [Caminibacter pacificus]QCI28951.1 hypothetical protein C6V80_08200 [Caminibacter pacificus]ROR39543.1 putative RNase toxin 21 of polymorphic toxin system [Caminibacter pacificus]
MYTNPVGWAVLGATTLAIAGYGIYEYFHADDEIGIGVCYSEEFDPTKWPRLKKGNQKRPGFKNPKDGSVWEKDLAGHGGRKWKRWKNEREWRKGKKREGSYDENGNRIAD